MESKQEKYSRFGGWLLILLLGQVFSILVNAFEVEKIIRVSKSFPMEIQNNLKVYNLVVIVQAVILILGSLLIVLTIRKRNLSSLRKVQMMIVLIAIVNVLGFFIQNAVLEHFIGLVFNDYSVLWRFIPGPILWTLYLMRSKRVKIYYKINLALDKIY